MFEGFETQDIETSGATIHLCHGGDGRPLLLLHGNPLSHVAWHKIAGEVAKDFHVVAADLRWLRCHPGARQKSGFHSRDVSPHQGKP